MALIVGLLAGFGVFGAEFARGMSDTGCHPRPAQELYWTAGALLVVGIGGLVARLLGRWSARVMRVARGVTVVVAGVSVVTRTDWGMWRRLRAFNVVSALAGWRKIKQLRKENYELRRANEILKGASVFFATELEADRPK